MILIALGSNLPGPWGSPRQTLASALEAIEESGISLQGCSSGYRTKAYGDLGQPDYVNAVASVLSHLPPEALLLRLHRIERQAARARGERWGARTLDIDLLSWNGRVSGGQAENGRRGELGYKPISLPHPGLCKRPFVAIPLAEIAPRWHHPVTGETAGMIARSASRFAAGAVLEAVEL
ncbi:MAG: 2-amino-4-hydroxy-6-hydroxymethyldihydropteridine diphosphokinase [Pseudomonadota bacterium]